MYQYLILSDTRGLINVIVSVRLCEVILECIFNTGYYGDCKVVIKSLTNNFTNSHVLTQNGSNASAISTVIHLGPGRYKIHGYDWNDSTRVLPMCPPVRTSINVITCKPTLATKTSTNVTPTPGIMTFVYSIKPFLYSLGGTEHAHSHNIGAIIGGIVGGVIAIIFVIVIVIYYKYYIRSVMIIYKVFILSSVK